MIYLLNYKTIYEDTQLILYLIDSKVPEEAHLDIFERVNNWPKEQSTNPLCSYAPASTLQLRREGVAISKASRVC